MESGTLLLIHPIDALALLVALAAIGGALASLRWPHNRHNRLLTAIVGFAAVMHGMRIVLKLGSPANLMDDSVNLTVSVLYLGSLVALRSWSRTHRTTEYALRLAEGTAPAAVFANRPFVPVPGEDLSKVVLDAAPMPMFAVGLDGNVHCWNRAAEQTLGWSRDEVLGRKLPRVVLDPGEGIETGAIRLVRKDGEPVHHAVQSVPLRDSKGAVSGILTILST